MIIPKDVGEFDTLTLCNVLNLTKRSVDGEMDGYEKS